MIGTTLGPYRILEQIGLGGMATVYKAFQPGMDRLVALKILPAHYASTPRFVQRFEQEARIIAKLEHRNIIPIYDFGSHDGTTYLAMRYLQAGTVKDILAQGTLSLADVARVIGDVAAALNYAHAQGIIHRDVKPSNILVDKQGNAYLTDFGIAKVLEATQEFTGSAALGTPPYMAPEQTLGKPVTAQTDVYSLGVMLYEMVTGKPPFEADTPMATAIMHVHNPLPLPRTLKPDLPEAVELVILKALAKDPKHRYLTAGELARAFENAIASVTSTESQRIPRRLIELSSKAAAGKAGEEVTRDVLKEVKGFDSKERRKKLRQWGARVAIGGVVVAVAIALVLAIRQTSQDFSIAQAASTALAEDMAQQTGLAALPTATFTPTPTLDLKAAAIAQAQATGTRAAIKAVTKQAVETFMAMFPTQTPTITDTPDKTNYFFDVSVSQIAEHEVGISFSYQFDANKRPVSFGAWTNKCTNSAAELVFDPVEGITNPTGKIGGSRVIHLRINKTGECFADSFNLMMFLGGISGNNPFYTQSIPIPISLKRPSP